MNYHNIQTSLEDSILTITINRPKQLNALNKQTIEELNNAILAAEKNKAVKVLVITGTY